MKMTWKMKVLGILAGMTLALGLVAEPEAEAVGDEAGFVDLLADGKLEAWKNRGNYKLEDGVVYGTKGKLFSVKQYADFHFKFEFKLAAGSNNGLAIRTRGKPIELQILDNTAEKFAKLKDYQMHGSLYNYVPAKTGFLKPVGEWNHQEVICKGSQVTVILNGTTIMEADLSQVKPISTSYVVPYINKAEKGVIGFLGHNKPIWLRNLRIKEL